MKKLLITFCLVAFAASMAFASEARLDAMGMGSFYFDGDLMSSPNSIIKDDANIGMYPSTVNYHPNIFWGEIEHNEAVEWGGPKSWHGYSDYFYKAGALFSTGDDDPCVFGVYFSTVPYDGYYFDLDEYDDWHSGTNHKINFYYGRNISDMPFGFTFGYYGSTYEQMENNDSSYYYDYNEEHAFSRYEFGFGLSPMEGKLDLALSLALTSWTNKEWEDAFGDGAGGNDSGLVDQTEPDGNFEFAFRGRYWMDPNGKFTFVPHFAFQSIKYGRKYNSNFVLNDDTYAKWQTNYTNSTKMTVIDLGIGMNYDASEDVLVATDFGVEFGKRTWETDYADTSSTDSEYDESVNAMPYFRLGIDAKIFKWLDFRAGVMAMWNKYKYENSSIDTDDPLDHDAYTYEETETFTTTQTFIGVGMHWGDLEIDAVLDPEFLLKGPDFVGGGNPDYYYSKDDDKAPGSSQYHLFTKVSLTYSF